MTVIEINFKSAMTADSVLKSASVYRNCYIIEYDDAARPVDVMDTASGKWMVVKTVRQARWNASVWARLQHQFGLIPEMPPKHPKREDAVPRATDVTQA